MAYTSEQINTVCSAIDNGLKKLENVTNISFIGSTVRQSMVANKTPEEIGIDVYNAMKSIVSLNNIQIVLGIVHESINSLSSEPQEEADPQGDTGDPMKEEDGD